MTEKISLLSIRSMFDAGPYADGMNKKIAADRAGAASSTQLGNTIQQTYQKIGAAGSVAERLSRTYVQGYADAAKFNQAINALGRGIETGNVPMQRADAILSGIVSKFGMTASAADVAARGYVGLAGSVERLNSQLEQQGRLQSASQLSPLQQRINGAVGISSGADGSVQRAADIAAYGQALDDLRAKYNPLYAIERAYAKQIAEINQAHKVGAISAAEQSAALTRAQVAYTGQVRAIEASNKAMQANRSNAALNAAALTNLGFQINDVATQAALGQDPLRILAAQGGQFYQILSQGEGGVRGSLAYIRTLLVGMVTPARAAVAAIAGIVAVGTSAAVAWANAQSSITLALRGVGSAAGVTVGDINRISLATAALGDLTVSEARAMAVALAETGKITAEVAERATALGKGFQLVFGLDNAAAAKTLASALADPAKGVDELNKRLGEFDDATAQSIKRMQAQGDRLGAQTLLLDGVARGVAEATKQNNFWARSWDSVAASASETYSRIGRFLNAGSNFDVSEAGLARAKQQLADMQRARDDGGVMGSLVYSSGIGILQKEIERLTPLVEAATAKTKELETNAKSVELGEIVRQVDPLTTQLLDVANLLAKIRGLSEDPLVMLKLDPATTQALERTKDLLEKRSDPSIPRTPSGFALDDADVAAKQRMARTNEQKASAAYAASLSANRRNSNTTAIEDELIASLAYKTTLADLRREQQLAFEQRRFQSKQQIEDSRLELSLVDAGIGETVRARTEFQLMAQAKAEAFRNGSTVSDAEIKAIKQEADETAKLAQAYTALKMAKDLAFEREQLGRAGTEQDVYSQLRSAGLLTNGEIESAEAKSLAAQIRLNNAIRANMETSREFAKGFISDMLNGASATEALANGLNRLADKLMDIGLDYAFQSLFGGKSGANGVLSGLFGQSGPTTSGWDAVVVPQFHNGGIVGANDNASTVVHPSVFAGARRYHSGGVAGLAPDEVPAILQRGERVLKRGQSAGGVQTLDVRVTLDNDMLRAVVMDESGRQVAAGMNKVRGEVPGIAAATMVRARDRGAA